MAHQDYVKRGQAKKRHTKNSKNKKNASHQTPWFRITIASLLVAGFVFGLYFLQSTPNSRKEDIANKPSHNAGYDEIPSSKANDVTKYEADDLPVLKEEEWAFIDALPEYSVEVDVEELPKSDKKYIMQCFSVRTMEKAEALRAKIAFQGLEANVVESNGSNGRWFRVVLGPYDRKRAAEKDRHHLRRAKIPGCIIW
ncbi:SPOR domain-containing protein [Agaribacter marinus]|uniref:Cell division protein FtsN n=1 Tax=Agaribacter marinus TaxID=1431249 RepID=A0AA37WM37_9ALTE|nr:SPOR domain-containing protein [Agaribacter marinus]GLR72575.1 cell division protein FtsN [Agaribacter marinus]